MAASYLALFTLIIVFIIMFMTRASCRASGDCGRQVFWVTLIVAAPLIFFLAWLWGRWHERKTLFVTRRLERRFKKQVELVDLERERLAAVLDQMVDGVVLINHAGRVQYINPVAARLLKTTAEEALDQQFIGIAYHHQLVELWQNCQRLRQEQTEIIEIARDGLFVQAELTPLTLADQEVTMATLHDLTRIRQLETVRRDFISNVSHELLTPISAVRAVLETIQDGAIDDPPAAERFLDQALSEVDSMTQIVAELLTLSRIESGQVTLRLKPTSVEDLLGRPMSQLATPAERKGITLVQKIEPDLPLILADVEQLWQVFSNILHNAFKFTPEGGTISVTATLSADGGDEVEFEIKDTGSGIQADDLPRIFERFYKADHSRHRDKVSGTGLGLSIAKHIVQAHAGRIWVKSKPNKGTSFFISLPVSHH